MLPNSTKTLRIFAKDLFFAKDASFRQIWSHWTQFQTFLHRIIYRQLVLINNALSLLLFTGKLDVNP